MKLSDAHSLSLVESLFVEPLPILEAGEAPRWNFNYDAWRNDPKPDILLLGAYRHPNTGNNLVGGVNLNYLSSQQRDNLARALPQIMQAGNLYSRYHKGKELVPDVFDNFYRTYNSAHIRGVQQGVMFPKYGFMQAAKNYLKKQVGKLFKSPEQQKQDAEPQFPNDLSGMKDQLDQVVGQLNQRAAQQQQLGLPEPETPEMQAARQNFRQFQIDRARRLAGRPELNQLKQASQDLQAQQVRTGQVPMQAVPPQVQQQAVEQPGPITPQYMGQEIEKERLENQQELMDPRNDVSLDPEDEDLFDRLDESIMYYSPCLGRYVMESISLPCAATDHGRSVRTSCRLHQD
jgi:hypothetical protein